MSLEVQRTGSPAGVEEATRMEQKHRGDHERSRGMAGVLMVPINGSTLGLWGNQDA